MEVEKGVVGFFKTLPSPGSNPNQTQSPKEEARTFQWSSMGPTPQVTPIVHSLYTHCTCCLNYTHCTCRFSF